MESKTAPSLLIDKLDSQPKSGLTRASSSKGSSPADIESCASPDLVREMFRWPDGEESYLLAQFRREQ